MITHEHKLLCATIDKTEAKIVVELGSYHGGTTAVMAQAASKYGGIVVTMDSEDYSKEVLSRYTNCIFLHGKSEDIGLLWRSPIDVLFVDTAPNDKHTGEQVIKELNIWARHVRGAILFHDTQSFEGVRDAILTWQAANADEWTQLEEWTTWPGMGTIWRKPSPS